MRLSRRLILQRYDATSICSHRVSEVSAVFNFKAVQNDTNLKMEEVASSLDMSVNYQLSQLFLPEDFNRHFTTCLCNAKFYVSVYPLCTFSANNCCSRYRCRSGKSISCIIPEATTLSKLQASYRSTWFSFKNTLQNAIQCL
jgi:hypothetical protein